MISVECGFHFDGIPGNFGEAYDESVCFVESSPRVCDLSHVWGHGHQSLQAVPEHASLRTAQHLIKSAYKEYLMGSA